MTKSAYHAKGINEGSSSNFKEKALKEINEAYNHFLTINVFDISKEGQDIWEATKRNYDNKIDKVES